MTSYLDALLTADEANLLALNIETTSVDASLDNYAGEIAMLEADALKKQGQGLDATKMIQQARVKFEEALKEDPKYRRAEKNLKDLALAIPMTL